VNELVEHKELMGVEVAKGLLALKKYKPKDIEYREIGNPIVYHYFLKHMVRTRVGKRPSIAEVIEDEEAYKKLFHKAMSMKRWGTLVERVYEADRINGAVVFFKPSTAVCYYDKYEATAVLDPCAGWGGRMLGAWSRGINYTGIDTNLSLKPTYEKLMEDIGYSNAMMIWDDCMKVDFGEIEYDMVLTSPPYLNQETYEHMTPFESKDKYYTDFLVPLIKKCLRDIHIGDNKSPVCFNISPVMYDDLTLKYGFRACDERMVLPQKKRYGEDRENFTYVWFPRRDENPALNDMLTELETRQAQEGDAWEQERLAMTQEEINAEHEADLVEDARREFVLALRKAKEVVAKK
jgi:hypothetical protein